MITKSYIHDTAIRSLQTLDHSQIKPDETCAICLIDFNKGGHVLKPPECVHLFHKECLVLWLDTSSEIKCPMCRKKIITAGITTDSSTVT
jgi:E3 ubiquitin-protein ligase DOA10